jgi:hypothetical protein
MGVLAKEIEATYEVLAKMGEGGMGAVYKVRHRFFDELRVIKVMQAQMESVGPLKERFLGEAKRGKQLRHPNLAEVLDFSVAADGTSYIVMEFIDGVNLRDLLVRNGGPLDYRTVIPIAEQALAALGFLHSRRFVHRDISPDNIMLTEVGSAEPRVKLIDLGIAKSLESTLELTMAGAFIGKVPYASPEQFSGKVDPRSDIYSLGVVLYEALTNAKPITGNNTMSVVSAHLNDPPRPFAETDPEGKVPQAVCWAVLKALAKSPDDRYQNAAEFAEALRATLPFAGRRTIEEPVVTTPAAVPLPASVPAKPAPVTEIESGALETVPPSRGRWFAVAAVVAVLVAVGAFALWQRSQSSAVPKAIAAGSTLTVAAPVKAAALAPAADGQLLINALPWGHVTSVIDGAGRERLTAGEAETPLLLSLPAGAYKVRLTNPSSSQSVDLDATVRAGALSRVEAELDRIEAGEYVDRAGIGQ